MENYKATSLCESQISGFMRYEEDYCNAHDAVEEAKHQLWVAQFSRPTPEVIGNIRTMQILMGQKKSCVLVHSPVEVMAGVVAELTSDFARVLTPWGEFTFYMKATEKHPPGQGINAFKDYGGKKLPLHIDVDSIEDSFALGGATPGQGKGEHSIYRISVEELA
jgi:hypothetical protein